MAFDPITLLTIAALLLGTMSILMIRSSRGEGACLALREWGVAFASHAIGLTMVLLAPNDVTSPVRVLGNAALMLSVGLVWAAAQGSVGARHPGPPSSRPVPCRGSP